MRGFWQVGKGRQGLLIRSVPGMSAAVNLFTQALFGVSLPLKKPDAYLETSMIGK